MIIKRFLNWYFETNERIFIIKIIIKLNNNANQGKILL